VRGTLTKAALIAAVASLLLACGKKDAAETAGAAAAEQDVFAKVLQHQEAMLKILEDNKDDTAKAVAALEAYKETNKAALAALEKEGEEFAKGFEDNPMAALEALAKYKPRFEALTKRQMALAQSHPELMAHEKVRSAFEGPM